MNKRQYLDALRKGLRWMPEPDRTEALADYEAHFAAGLAKGKSEEEIAAHLGDPAETIRMFHTESRLAAAEETVARARSHHSAASVLNAILAGIGLGFFNLIIILPVFFSLVAVVLSLYAAAAAIAVSGIAVMLSGFFYPAIELGPHGLTVAITFFAGLALICLGILACVGCWYVSKYFGIGMMKYVQFNIDIVRGRSQKRAMNASRPAMEPEAYESNDTDYDSAKKTACGGWLRRTGDALDAAAEKTAGGIRKAGKWIAGEYRKIKEWCVHLFKG